MLLCLPCGAQIVMWTLQPRPAANGVNGGCDPEPYLPDRTLAEGLQAEVRPRGVVLVTRFGHGHGHGHSRLAGDAGGTSLAFSLIE